MTRYIAHATGSNNHERALGYFNTAFLFLLFSAFIAIVVGLSVANYLDKIFEIPDQLLNSSRYAALSMAFTAALTLIYIPFYSWLIAHQRFQLVNLVGIISTLLRALATYFLLTNGFGILSLALLGTFLIFTELILLSSIIIIQYECISISIKHVKKNYLKELLNYGYKSFAISLSLSLIYQSDLFVIGVFLKPDDIAIYSFAGTLVIYINQFVNKISFTFGPQLAQLYAQEKNEEICLFFLKTTCLMYMLSGLIFAGGLVYSSYFYILWIGEKYSYTATILNLLLISQFFSIGLRVAGAVLMSMARIGAFTTASIIEGILNLVLSLLLVKHYELMGVALGAVIPALLHYGVWFPFYICKVLNIRYILYFPVLVGPSIILTILIYYIGILINFFSSPVSWILFFVNVIFVTLFGFVLILIFYSLVLKNEEYLSSMRC